MIAGVYDLARFDEGMPGSAALFVGGGFQNFADLPTNALARWDGWGASKVGTGLPEDVGVYAFAPLAAPREMLPAGLYVAGDFFEAGGVQVNRLARWDGHAWHDVGGGLTSPDAVFGFAACIFDDDGDGPGPPSLYVGGQFWYAGGVPADGLARWDGQTWSQGGGGLSTGNASHPNVYSMVVYDDGRGPALHVGGSFYYAGGVAVQNIARWDGQTWEPLGGTNGGVTAAVETVCVYDEDGEGPGAPSLFVGGQFSYAGGKPIKRLVRWDGQEWSSVGSWPGGGAVRAAAVWKAPDDERANLYIGGYFYHELPNGTLVRGIARWDGQSWRDLDYGIDGFGQGTNVNALASFDEDGDGPNPGGLYVGGSFLYAGSEGIETHHIARWGCPLAPRCEADLDHNGALDLFDFLAFINLFNADDPAADCDANQSLDLFDFLCFVNAFNAGC
jgi:hypothetical protein